MHTVLRSPLGTFLRTSHTHHKHIQTHANTILTIITMITRNNPPVSSADRAPQKMHHTLAPHLLLIMRCNGDSGVRDAGIMAALIVAEIEVYSGDRV